MASVNSGQSTTALATVSAILTGAKWATQAPRPWVDKLDIESKTRTRVMDSHSG